MQLTWRTSLGVTCFHAADMLRQGWRLREPLLQAALSEPVDVLGRALSEERLPAEAFWQHIVPLAAEFDTPRQLAEVVLTKLQGSVEARVRVPRFERHLRGVRAAFLQAQPGAAASQAALGQSLQQQWNLQGHALLNGIPAWTDEEILVEDATVFALPPLCGGGGAAHLPYNSVRVEAAEDDDAELPEVLRLAWLLSQLNLDLPRFSENVPRPRVPLVAALAVIPVVLAAAESARRLTPADDLLERALRRWLPPSDRVAAWATTLGDWWETYSGRRPAWSAALQALDQLLRE